MSSISQFIPNEVITAETVIANLASAAELAMYAFGGYAYDDVLVLDQFYNQLFDLARPMKCNVNVQSKLMDHPIESGAIITDFRVVLPTEIELCVICTSSEYWSVYQQIKAIYLMGVPVIVQTKADTFYNMVIQSMPHDETPEMFDVLAVEIKLREVLIAVTQYQSLPPAQVANANDQSTVSGGQQSAAPEPTGSIASRLLKSVTGVK